MTHAPPPVVRTRFTDLFGLEHPVMSAPMALHSGGTLAAAVSAAGGLGSFGGIHDRIGPEWVTQEAQLVRSMTDQPFAVGFITPFLPFTEPYLDAALDAGAPAIVLSFSDPAGWAERITTSGSRLICQVQTLAGGDRAVECGADALIAQGHAAGGHTGTAGLIPLLRALRDRHPHVPILAAGGVADGQGLAAVLVAGADGVSLGTAFLATPEAIEIPEHHKAAIVDSDGGDTVFTRSHDIVSGFPWPDTIGERVRRDVFSTEWAGREAELQAAVAAGHAPADHAEPLLYGESAGQVTRVRPAAEVVTSIAHDATEMLRRRVGELLPDTRDQLEVP